MSRPALTTTVARDRSSAARCTSNRTSAGPRVRSFLSNSSECLRGDIAEGFSLVVYEGGGVDELEACVRSMDVTALYTLSEFVSYILGAPEFVNRPFRDLFAGGLPLMTPLVARSEGQPGGR